MFIGDGSNGCEKDVVVISSDSGGEVQASVQASGKGVVKDEGTIESSVIVTSYKLISFWSYTHRHKYTHIILCLIYY